jgi:D-sedoheptulose 7-phosphate isomerase
MAGERPPGGMASLYPFLYESSSGPTMDTVMEEVSRSTAEKALEIVALREQVAERDGARIAACAEAMAERFAAGGRLLSFGNGGSSTDAQDVTTTFMFPGGEARPLPALALTADMAVVTALANDIGFEVVFARQIAAWGRPQDIALGLSTSGGSAEAETIDHLFVIPSSSVHRIQEAQTTVFNVLHELTLEALGATA